MKNILKELFERKNKKLLVEGKFKDFMKLSLPEVLYIGNKLVKMFRKEDMYESPEVCEQFLNDFFNEYPEHKKNVLEGDYHWMIDSFFTLNDVIDEYENAEREGFDTGDCVYDTEEECEAEREYYAEFMYDVHFYIKDFIKKYINLKKEYYKLKEKILLKIGNPIAIHYDSYYDQYYVFYELKGNKFHLPLFNVYSEKDLKEEYPEFANLPIEEVKKIHNDFIVKMKKNKDVSEKCTLEVCVELLRKYAKKLKLTLD